MPSFLQNQSGWRIPFLKLRPLISPIQNQLILSGTAYYKMNHFYAYFLKWRDIIKSKYDPVIN
jgi:hypothetical protein